MSFFNRHKKIIISLFTLIVSVSLTIGFALLTGNFKVTIENVRYSSVISVIFSYAFIAAYFGLCIFLRSKKQVGILRGLLIYQLIGMLAFVIHLLLLMAEEESFLSVGATQVFYLWSLPYHEGCQLIMEYLHFPVRYVLMLFIGMMTYVTAKSLHGITLDCSFEKKIQEKKETEAQAEEEAKRHRIQTAKEVDDYNAKIINKQ